MFPIGSEKAGQGARAPVAPAERRVREAEGVEDREQEIVVGNVAGILEKASGAKRAAGAPREHVGGVDAAVHVALGELVAPEQQAIVEQRAASLVVRLELGDDRR